MCGANVVAIAAYVVAFVIMLIVTSVLNWLLNVDYFYNDIFFAFFGLGLGSLIHAAFKRRLIRLQKDDITNTD